MDDVARYTGTAWKRLGQAVRRRRVALGLTQQELADAASLGVNTITNIENGSRARELNLGRVNRALGWMEGSWQMILEGGDPMVEEAPEQPKDDALRIERPSGLTDDEWAAIREKLVGDLTFWLRNRH